MKTWTKTITIENPCRCYGCGFVYEKGTRMRYGLSLHWCETCVIVMDKNPHDDDWYHLVGNVYNEDPQLWHDVHAGVIGIVECIAAVEGHLEALPPASVLGVRILNASWKKIKEVANEGPCRNDWC